MRMPAVATAASTPLRRSGRDPLREAVEHLARALPARADAHVLVDLLEDDLREGLEALGDVEDHFTEVLDALRSGEPTPLALLEAGDDLLVLQRLEVLFRVVSQIRRRYSQAAGLLHRG